MLDRRRFLAASPSAAALSGPAAARIFTPTADDVVEDALLTPIAYELLSDHPENATTLGLDKGKGENLKSRLSDRALAGKAREAAAVAARLVRLRRGDRPGLSATTLLDLEVTN